MEALKNGFTLTTDRLQKLNAAVGIALPFAHLYHGYSSSTVHCDIKASIVLLDQDIVAHSFDFGFPI